MTKIIYHGSNVGVTEPNLNMSVRALDFGKGFYTTDSYEQAKEWAIKKSQKFGNIPMISRFEFDLTDLRIKSFEQADKTWLDFVFMCRKDINTCLDKEFDVIIGAVANDTLFRIIGYYEDNTYDWEETIKRLKVNPVYNQLCICSDTGISKLQFLDSEVIKYE